jgi:hypothetical protein
MARQIPRGLNPQSYRKAAAEGRVNIQGVVETIWQPIYDTVSYAAAGAASTQFFQNPIGQAGKTLQQTNMELAGQIPKGQNFLITGIQVELIPGVNPEGAAITNFTNDNYSFYKAGALVLRIGAKDFIRQGNLMKFAPVNRLAGQAATGLAAHQVSYAQAAGREFAVADLMLESNQNFGVEILNGATLPSGSAANVQVTLNGFLYRNAQ